MRFQFGFMYVEKKVMSKFKGFKAKKKASFTLKEAEALVYDVYQKWESPTTVALTCTDTEDGVDYIFEEIEIIPRSMGGTPVNLINEIEKQIFGEGAEAISSPNMLLSAISTQYGEEPDVMQEITEPPIKKEKKGFFLRKKEKDQPLNLNSSVENEHQEEEWVTPILNSEEEEEMDNSPLEEEDFSEEFTQNNVEELEEEFDPFKEEEEMEEELPSRENSNYESQTYEKHEYNVIEPKYDSQSQELRQEIIIKKHETVKLPPYDEYVVFGSDISNKITDMIDKLSVENLFRFLGTSSDSKNLTQVERYKVNYIKQRLVSERFEVLRENYQTEVGRIVNEGEEKLREGAEMAWTLAYDIEAKEECSKELANMQAELETTITEFEENQKRIADEKVNKLKAQHEIEIQSILQRQNAELNELIATENNRMMTMVEAQKNALTTEHRKATDELIDEQMYKLKSYYTRQLIEGKRQLKNTIGSELKSINDNYWDMAVTYLNEISEAITKCMPVWADEIKSMNELEKDQHKREMELANLKLKEKRMEIDRQKAKFDLDKLTEIKHNNKLLEVELKSEKNKNELLTLQINQIKENQAMLTQQRGSKPLVLFSGK